MTDPTDLQTRPPGLGRRGFLGALGAAAAGVAGRLGGGGQELDVLGGHGLSSGRAEVRQGARRAPVARRRDRTREEYLRATAGRGWAERPVGRDVRPGTGPTVAA